MFRLLIVCVFCLSSACAVSGSNFHRFSAQHLDGTEFQGVRLLGSLSLEREEIAGLAVGGLSGLAWDEDEQRLYAISDNGLLFSIQVSFKEGVLNQAQVTGVVALQDSAGKPLYKQSKSLSDTEGLALLKANNGVPGDTELLVSFERDPQIVRFNPQGKWLAKEQLPKGLDNSKRYASRNKMLEAVAIDAQGDWFSVPEYPLPEDHNHWRLFNQQGQAWLFERYPAPNSALVGIEALNEGEFLVLERAYVSPFAPMIIALHRWTTSADCLLPKQKLCASQLVAEFDSSKGWSVDNFEGLAHHRENFFFMISDDNHSGMQQTLVNYFQLREPESAK